MPSIIDDALNACTGRIRARLRSTDPHAVTITVKAVFRLHRVSVSAQHIFAPAKSGHKRKQRGAGQVKVREKLTDDAKRLSGEKKNLRFEPARLNRPVKAGCTAMELLRRIFERSHYRCANSQDRATRAMGAGHGVGGFFRNFVEFAMNAMFLQPFRADRFKRTQAHVQCDCADLETPLAEAGDYLFCEMQSRGGCSDRAAPVRKDEI